MTIYANYTDAVLRRADLFVVDLDTDPADMNAATLVRAYGDTCGFRHAVDWTPAEGDAISARASELSRQLMYRLWDAERAAASTDR